MNGEFAYVCVECGYTKPQTCVFDGLWWSVSVCWVLSAVFQLFHPEHCVCFDCGGSDYISVETERLSSSNSSVNTVSHPPRPCITPDTVTLTFNRSGHLASKNSHCQSGLCGLASSNLILFWRYFVSNSKTQIKKLIFAQQLVCKKCKCKDILLFRTCSTTFTCTNWLTFRLLKLLKQRELRYKLDHNAHCFHLTYRPFR